jgi:CHAT domain-containing protein
VSDSYGEAIVLSDLGVLYHSLGDQNAALDYYNRALELSRKVGDQTSQATTLISIGTIQNELSDRQKALESFDQALALTRAIGSRDGQARALESIAKVHHSSGNNQQALEFINQALTLYRTVGNRLKEGAALSNIGVIYDDTGDHQKALKYFEQALILRRAVSDKSGEADTLYNIARTERAQNNLVVAHEHIDAALTILENVRAKIDSLELRSSYRSSVQRFYDLQIDILMRMHAEHASKGYDGEALQVSERARARTLLEMLEEARADIREGASVDLLVRERSLRQQINAKADFQLRLLNRSGSDEQAKAVAIELKALTSQYQEVETRIRTTSPRYAELTQPLPLSLGDIQTKVLDADTMLLEYALGDDRSYLWAITSNAIKSYELPKQAEVEELARNAYRQLTAPKRSQTPSPASPAQLAASSIGQDRVAPESVDALVRLSEVILGPVATQLKRQRLVIVADGALQYVPFGALPLPRTGGIQNEKYTTPLIVKHEIVNLPSASALASLRREVAGRQPAPKTLAVIADPVFEKNDSRLKAATKPSSENSAGSSAPLKSESRGLGLVLDQAAKDSGVVDHGLPIPRLPGTRQEAMQILALVDPASSKRALDFAANRSMATAAELAQYRYLHVATHGFLDSVNPELSGLVLSMFDEDGNPQNGFLRAHEVFNLRLPVELVVLSACQTGLGKDVRGEGLVGLTRGFMYAGTPRVVVSLWNVNDKATADLMTLFYQGMLRDKLRPSAALREAQIKMWKQKRWNEPFYWAAFTLQGEWR